MSDKDEQLEIEITETDAEGSDVTLTDDDKPAVSAAPVDDPTAAIEQLSKQLEAERRARMDAENYARQAAQMAQSAMGEADDTNLHLVGNAIETVKRDTELLTAKYAELMSIGDYESAAKVQAVVSTNSAKLLQLENGLSEMQRMPKRQPQLQAPPPSHGDKIDQIISEVSKSSPRSTTWLKNNRDQLSDDKAIRKMFRAHEDAVDEGIEVDSDKYFAYLEGRMGLSKPAPQESPMSSASKPVARAAAPAAAPVNNGGGSRPNVVRLSRAEADTAKMFGMTEQEYAKHKIALQREGKMSH
jgi:hypothetical protein